ncbi:MAG: Fe-S protein assembly co-chaperone HscB [Myxococcales bacterium]|nr:Fe-S protein assembly co-chaperone HscB [Myxococcales bacterium]
MKCWRCQREYGDRDFICPECGALQGPRPDLSHFDRLEMSPSYHIDTADLADRHRRLQRQFHPDRHASRSAVERRFSLEHATALNDAFRVLKDPVKRAEYMIGLRGLDMRDESNQIKLPPMFLMEMLELREALDELSGSDTHVERGRIEHDVASRYERTLDALGAGLDGTDASIVVLAQYAAQLKYLKRILEDLHALAD